MKSIKIGFAPTRRSIFSAPDAPLGIFAAVRHNRMTDYVVTVLSLLLSSAMRA